MGLSATKQPTQQNQPSQNYPFDQPINAFGDFTSENIIISKDQLNDSDLDFITKYIMKLSFVAEMSPQLVNSLARKFRICFNTQDQWLFQQGSVASYFFLIKQGRVEVVKDGFHARTLNKGDGFGELALLYDIRRSSSIKIAKEFRKKNVYYILNKEDFEQIRQMVNFPLSQKFLKILQNHPDFHFLTRREINSLASVANRLNFYANQRITTRFDMPHALYIITEGQVRLRYPGGFQVFLGPHEHFGFYGNNSIQYSVIATQETICYTIGRETLQIIFRQNMFSLFLITRLKNILLSFSIIRERMTYEQIAKLARQFNFKMVKPFEPICIHKKDVSALKVPLTCNDESPIIGLNQLMSGDRVFSHDYLAQRQGFCAQIQTNKFLHFYNQEQIQLEKNNETYFNDIMFGPLRQYPTTNLTIQLKKQNKFAIKFEVLKALQNDQKAIEKIRSISKILKKVNFKMIRSYYDEKIDSISPFISLQYISGVSIKHVVAQIGPLPLSIAKFYLASLILCLQSFHKKNILFRNFSFQSFRIDRFGYFWVYDIMESQQLDDIKKTDTFQKIGDPQWQPPQIIKQEEFSFGVDFWGLGILAYVIIFGYFPFGKYEKDQYNIYKQIIESDIQFPINCRSKYLRQFITILLQKDAKSRNQLKWSKIKELELFRGFDWEKLMKKTMDSPYFPDIVRTDNL